MDPINGKLTQKFAHVPSLSDANPPRRNLCTWVERSPAASNYRGEILGALGYTLVMKAVLEKDRESRQLI